MSNFPTFFNIYLNYSNISIFLVKIFRILSKVSQIFQNLNNALLGKNMLKMLLCSKKII